MKNPLLVVGVGIGIAAGAISLAVTAQPDPIVFRDAQIARLKTTATKPNPYPTPYQWSPAFGFQIPGLAGEINLALITYAEPDPDDATRSLVMSADGVTRSIDAPWGEFRLYLARVTRRSIWIPNDAPTP